MNHKQIIPKKYNKFVSTYLDYAKWLYQQSHVNHYSIELFAYTYEKWAKGKSLFSRTKSKFLRYMKTIKGERIVFHENGKGADNVNALLSLFKGLIPKALKFRFNPLKLWTVSKDFLEVETFWGSQQPKSTKSRIEERVRAQNNLWWYHINEIIGHMVSYYKYAWSMVSAGDVIYENEGFNGITGHVEIVEGRYYDVKGQTFYIKVIEAISPYGVTHGLLDDQRFEKRGGTVLRIPNLTTEEVINLIAYANTKIGEKYALRFAAGTDEGEWYCSELVWKVFKHINRDILDRKGDLLKLRKIGDGINMAYDITKHHKKFNLSEHINTLDLVSIAGEMIVPHEIVDSDKFKKIAI